MEVYLISIIVTYATSLAKSHTMSFLLHKFGFTLLHPCGQEPIQAETILNIDRDI
jgi:hypothetical protein